jgi:hypothetical protein
MKCQDVIFVALTDIANANRRIHYSFEFSAISNTRQRCVSCVMFLFQAQPNNAVGGTFMGIIEATVISFEISMSCRRHTPFLSANPLSAAMI